MTDRPESPGPSFRKEADSGRAPPDTNQPHALAREDDRWRVRRLRRDWLILAIMIAIYLLWTGIVFFLVPGIR